MLAANDNRLREVSKPLFGNTYRLELLAIIGDFGGPFYARQIAAQMGVADNLVTSQLARLCELGLLEKRTASPHVLYTRQPSRVWEMANQLRAEFDGEPDERTYQTTEAYSDVRSDLDALLNALFGGEPAEQPYPADVPSDLDALLDALAELSGDERRKIEHHVESLTPLELRALGRIELWRTSERQRLRELVRTTVIPGLKALGSPIADPTDLITLADVLARRLRAELDDTHDPEEFLHIPPAVLRASEGEREIVRGRMRATTLPILDHIFNDSGTDRSALTIADLAVTEADDLQRWIDTIDKPAATHVPLASKLHLTLSRRGLRVADDERLVAQVRAGNQSAFEAIYDRHHAGIQAFCRHMLGSREEAEDVVQHTFAAAYQALLVDEREIALKARLYAIARNRCLSVLRVRREHLALEDAEAWVPATAGLAAEVEQREDLRALLGDLQRLPDDQRAALVLAELGTQSHEEIALILGVPTAKVKALVFQAREALMNRRL